MRDATDEACEGLWFAVVRQAVEDARLIPFWNERMIMYEQRQRDADTVDKAKAARGAFVQARTERNLCRDARNWITKPNPGFTEVCRMLNLDPDTARLVLTKAVDCETDIGHNLLRQNGSQANGNGRYSHATD